MTTYSSKSYVPVVPGDFQDIRLDDAYVISQDITALQAEARVADYLRNDTLAGGLSWTGVMHALDKHPQSHAKGRSGDPRVPVGYVVLVFLGLVLTGLGLVGYWLSPVIQVWLSS